MEEEVEESDLPFLLDSAEQHKHRPMEEDSAEQHMHSDKPQRFASLRVELGRRSSADESESQRAAEIERILLVWRTGKAKNVERGVSDEAAPDWCYELLGLQEKRARKKVCSAVVDEAVEGVRRLGTTSICSSRFLSSSFFHHVFDVELSPLD